MPDEPQKIGHGTLAVDAVLNRFQSKGEDRHTTGGRRRREKKRLSSTDGRVRRGLGRDKQWNVGCTQDLLDAGDDACDRFDLTKAELTERALKFYIRALEDGVAE